MGIAALGFCSFEGTHCTQVVTQRNATPPLLGDFGKSSFTFRTYKSATQGCLIEILLPGTKITTTFYRSVVHWKRWLAQGPKAL